MVTQANYFGTKCPKAGFGEAPQQAFLQPAGMQKCGYTCPACR